MRLMLEIIPFEPKYQDDMLFCLLSAKDNLGKIPRIKEDLFDIQNNYFDNGDMFWVAINNSRVIGMVGTKTVSTTDIWLKRLYIKPSMKRKGVGSVLLAKVEKFALSRGANKVHTRFSEEYKEASCFYPSKGFIEVERIDGVRHLVKDLTVE
jgi:GNAT superfamily N-acetyltransferase